MFRFILLGISAISVIALLAFWTISGKAFDILLLAALSFLIANTCYIFISRPAIKTSDILTRVSGSLALASMELQYQAEEAQIREAEAEKIRLAEDEYNKQKLQAAKDLLQHLRINNPQNLKNGASLPQITHQAQPKSSTLPLPPPVPTTANDARHSNRGDSIGKVMPPAAQISQTPSSTEASAQA